MVIDDRMSGVELLALYGEERVGAFLPGLRKGAKKAFAYTPQGYAYNMATKAAHRRRLMGDDSRIGAFLPGLKKIGKVTAPFTTAIAKGFLPASIVDAAAKVDPVKKGASASQALVAVNTSEKKKSIVPAKILGVDTKKVAIIGGGAVAALVLLKVLIGGK